jgi:hypothetical protein
MFEIGARYGMTATRVPFETGNPFAQYLRRSYRAKGMRVADYVYGLRHSGAMTAERLSPILDALPDGLSEIYMHPATGPYPGSAKGYRYAEELAALTNVQVLEKIKSSGTVCGGFADFAHAHQGAKLAS